MKIVNKIISYDEAMDRLFFPTMVVGMMQRDTTTIYGAFDSDSDSERMLGVAVVTATTGVASHCISYINIFERDEEPVLVAMLEYIESQYSGEDLLTVRLIGELDDYLDIDEILINNGYDALARDGKYVMYYLEDILDSEFTEKITSTEALDKKVYSYNELSSAQMSTFKRHIIEKKLPHQFECADLVFTKYYVADGEIKGYIDVKEEAKGHLVLTDAYVMSDKSAAMALPAMLSMLIKTSISFLPDDTVLYIIYHSNTFYEILKKAFGEAEIDYQIFEYAKRL